MYKGCSALDPDKCAVRRRFCKFKCIINIRVCWHWTQIRVHSEGTGAAEVEQVALERENRTLDVVAQASIIDMRSEFCNF